MTIQYRLALMSDQVYQWLDIANNDDDVRRIQGYADFIKWIHEDWQLLPQKEVCRHIKTGGLYEIVCWARNEGNLEPLVVYRSLENGATWARTEDEFNDGRFEKVNDTPQS